VSLLDDVHAALDEEGVAHALIGAAALMIHGVSRSSLDIDLLATDDALLDPGLWARHRLEADCRRGDATDPLAGVVRVTRAGDVPVDVVLFGPHGWQHAALERASGDGLRVVTAEDLIRLKVFAGGPRDRADIHALLDVHPALAGVDVGALPRRSADLWRAILSERS
jgi:hypothetical protein